jgi:hypothetical protein
LRTDNSKLLAELSRIYALLTSKITGLDAPRRD